MRGVMRVGCSGAKSEESSRWAATRAAAALLAWACCCRCSGDAYPSTGPERVGGPSTWLWPVHSPSPSHCSRERRWMASSRWRSSLIVERLSPARLSAATIITVKFVVVAAVRLDGLGVVAARRRLGRAGPHVASRTSVRFAARRVRSNFVFSRESSSQFLPPPVIPERRRPRLKLYTGETLQDN